MKYHREHPIRILSRTSHFAILLLLPVLRALFFSGGSLYQWISGVWIDLLVVIGILLLGWMVWFFDVYQLRENGIYLFTGIFRVQKRCIPFSKMTTAIIERPWYLQMFGAARLKLDTPVGGNRKLDLSLMVSNKDVGWMTEHFRPRQTPYTMPARVWSVAALSLISSNSFTGVLFLSALISQSGQILGAEFERQVVDNFTKTAALLAFGIPPAAAILALLIATGWLVSFLMNVMRYANFLVQSEHSLLTIQTGIWINKRTYYIETERVSFLEVRQTILTKVLRICSVLINTPGYGKTKGESPVLIPARSNRASLRELEAFFPNLPFGKRNVRPRREDFSRFLVVPMSLSAALLLAMLISQRLFPSFATLILFFSGMLAVLLALYFITRILSFSRTGFGVKNGIYTLEYCHGFLFEKVCFPEAKLSKIHIRQTFFQKKGNCCTVIFYTYGEKRRRHLISNLPVTEVETELSSFLKTQ